MISKKAIYVLLLVSSNLITNLHAVNNGNDVLTAPQFQTGVIALDASYSRFENSPVYELDNPRQTLITTAWKGNSDYNFKVRAFWNNDGIYIRLNITDNSYIPVENSENLETIIGDHIRLNLIHFSCGPDRELRQPWSIFLFPNPAAETCEAILQINSDTARNKIGRIETVLHPTGDAYSIILKLPYQQWDDLPRSNSQMKFQILFYDVDEKGKIANQFALFPTPRGLGDLTNQSSAYGLIRFTENVWVKIYPETVVFSDHQATFLMDYGNSYSNPIDATITLAPKSHSAPQPDQPPGSSSSLDVSHQLPENSLKQKVPVTFDLTDLTSGTYIASAKVGVFFDSNAFEFEYSQESGISYCPKMIEIRNNRPIRKLELAQQPDLIAETYRQLAGAGDPVWYAGIYDGSSNEFRQTIRKPGEYVVAIPDAKNEDIPWALFGGLDTLDGMFEPLILDIDMQTYRDAPSFPTEEPLLQNRQNLSRLTRDKVKFLLLLGIVVDQQDPDQETEVVVTSHGQPLVNQKFKATTVGVNHSFILRIWLTAADQKIKIENRSPHGPKIEIDFIALLGGSKPKAVSSAPTPSLEFSGTRNITIYNKILNTSHFLFQHYLIDSDGRPYSSLPGGSQAGINLPDWAMYMTEMAAWGNIKQARAAANLLPLYMGSSQNAFSAGKMDIGYPLSILGIYNVWRKSGEQKSFLDPLWLNCITRPLAAIVREIETNPNGLVNCKGEFGGYSDKYGAATVPMFFAVHAALNGAIEMARKSGYGDNAQSWRIADNTLVKNFNRNHVIPENSMNLITPDVFPASWGIPRQQGIVTILPANTWLYGKYEDGKPVFYNDNIRVFDTAYLLSGMAFWSDFNGFVLDRDTESQLRASFDFLANFSPVFLKPAWRRFSLLDYNNINQQNWAMMSTLLLDTLPITTNILSAFVNFTFDEYLSIPIGADIEVSPYTFEEKFDLNQDAENLGSTSDDLNISDGVHALKCARIMAGIDDHDRTDLKLIPRLTAEITKVSAANWLITNNSTSSGTAKINYTYEKITDDRYSLTLASPDKLDLVTVRLGPFSPKIRKVRVTNGDSKSDVNVQRSGAYSWAEISYKKVQTLEIGTQALIY